ncbi:MAG TPA: twin-arginine translocase TatA/TatE family subunit [bacterium]|nr:twin-arginine translocase TatA/TatE family subunit [bacterium]
MGRFEELLLILAIALLLFGPNKITDIAKAMGGALREFKKAANVDESPSQTTSAPASAAPSALPSESKPAESVKQS